MTPTRVALFASAYSPHLGGVEELVAKLAAELALDDQLAGVWTIRHPASLPAEERIAGVAVHRHPFVVPRRSARELVAFPGRALTGTVRVARQLRVAGATLVHVQCVSNQALYAWLAARLLGLPLVVTVQGELTMDAAGLFEQSAAMRWVFRRVVRRADAVTGCSGQTLDEAMRFAGRPTAGATVVYNGVDLGEFRSQAVTRSTRPYVVSLGRHVRQKGFDILLRAYLASGAATTHDLVIAGDGPDHAALVALADELGIGASVRFPGRADRSEVGSLLAGADVFVLPSRHEPMGIVNLEAMAAGAPVLATRVGGVPELVDDGRTGLLVPGDDAPAMAVALRRLLDDPGLRSDLRVAAAAEVERFAWPMITDQYRAVYASATTAAGSGRWRRLVRRFAT